MNEITEISFSFKESANMDQFWPAFLQAQSTFETIAKREVSHHGKYADLAAATEELLPKLNAAGICVVQPASRGENKTCLVFTRLIHAASGQWLGCLSELTMAKDDGQGYGSAVTYNRRYSLMAICCCSAAKDDDDGNAASKQDKREERRESQKGRLEIVAPLLREAGAKASDDARALLEESGLRLEQDDYRVNNEGRVIWPSLTEEAFSAFCAWLARKPKQETEPQPQQAPASTTAAPTTATDAHRALRTMLQQMGAKSADKAAGILATWGISATLQGGKIDWAAISLKEALKAPAAVWRGDVGALPNEA